MKYFKIRQDNTLPYRITLEEFNLSSSHRTFTINEAENLRDTTILYLSGNGDETAPDYLENPVYMVSDKAAKVFQMYLDKVILKKVLLIHKGNKRQEKYFHIVMDKQDVMDESCTYYPDGLVKKLVLNQKKIDGQHIFQIKRDRTEAIYISLAVLESLLRRNAIGILYEEVEVK